eukprot:974921-Prorocentrum_lima.AAC.1
MSPLTSSSPSSSAPGSSSSNYSTSSMWPPTLLAPPPRPRNASPWPLNQLPTSPLSAFPPSLLPP